MTVRQMEILYDRGIYSVDQASNFLVRLIHAVGEFHGRGKPQLEAVETARACKNLVGEQLTQRAYAIWILDEIEREAADRAPKT